MREPQKRVARSVSMPSRRGVHIEPLDPKVVKMLDLQSNILERLRAKLDLDKIPVERLHEEDLWQRAERATIDLVETLETSGELPKYIDQDTLIKETLSEALALGPLEDLLADEKIDEIIIDRRDRVVVGKDGQLRGSGKAFSSDEVFERVVKRLVAEAGARIDETQPIVDLRMSDGTRLTAAVAPVAARGACLVLRKPPTQMPQLADLVWTERDEPRHGRLPHDLRRPRVATSSCAAVRARARPRVVAALAAAAPAGERVISIEEVAELAIARDEWIQLETRAGVGKSAEVDLAALLETAVRLMPDRLVVGEVRGREALPLINALNASIDGAVVAMTGEGASAALTRLATLARVVAAGRRGCTAPRARRAGVRDRGPRGALVRRLDPRDGDRGSPRQHRDHVRDAGAVPVPRRCVRRDGDGAAVLRRARSARHPGRSGRLQIVRARLRGRQAVAAQDRRLLARLLEPAREVEDLEVARPHGAQQLEQALAPRSGLRPRAIRARRRAARP